MGHLCCVLAEPSSRKLPTGPVARGEQIHPKEVNMKVILWTLAIIFIIGLLVVLGLGGLIF